MWPQEYTSLPSPIDNQFQIVLGHIQVHQIGEAMKKNTLKTKKNIKSDQRIDDNEKNNPNIKDS